MRELHGDRLGQRWNMIELRVKTKDGTIDTIFEEESITLRDISMISFELDRLKKKLLGYEFDDDKVVIEE